MTKPIMSISRRTRRTPFSSRIESAGVKGYTVYNHMLLPTAYTTVAEDCAHLKEHVQVWDVFCEQQVEITGPDAHALVQLMTPRDIRKLVVGQCAYAPVVDENGGMINDPVILKLAEDRFWISLADSDVSLWAKGLAVGMNLDASVVEPGIGPLAIQGPKSTQLLTRVMGSAVRDIKFFRFKMIPFEGHAFLVARSGWSGQGGFEIYVDDPTVGCRLYDALFAAGPDLNVRPGCPNLVERIESGFLSYGNDMTIENNPFECGLDRFCHMGADTRFLARSALESILKTGGADRMLRGVAFDGPPCPDCMECWPITIDDEKVGDITSAAWSVDLDSNIAIAMIERHAWEPGTSVIVAAPDGNRQGRVQMLPFIRRG